MAKRWSYSDASIQQVGLMICTACRKNITDGAFRYRETDEAYLPQHKACCSDDPEWAVIQRRQTDYADLRQRRKTALREYIDRHGKPDEDLIEEVIKERAASSLSEQHR